MDNKFNVSDKFQEKDSLNSMATDSFKSNVSMRSVNNDAMMSTGSKGGAKDLNIEKMNLEMTVLHNGSSSLQSN